MEEKRTEGRHRQSVNESANIAINDPQVNHISESKEIFAAAIAIFWNIDSNISA